MDPAARKMIDPKVLLMACALALAGLTVWVVYMFATHADETKRTRDAERHECVMSAVTRGESLRLAEVMCA